jgi:hypothetical protein
MSCELFAGVLFWKIIIDYAYGCGAHPINNFCEDLLKLEPYKETLRDALFVSKTIKGQGLLSKIYNVLCIEILRKPKGMVLYSASR